MNRHRLVLLASIASVPLVLAAVLQPRALLAVLLAATLGLAAIPLGCLCLLLILPLVQGSWQPMLWPGAWLGARATPLIGLMLLPVLLCLGTVYPWVGQPEEGFRGAWLDSGTFILRALGYVLLWSVLAWWLPWRLVQRPGLAGPALVLLVLSVSAAAIDWAMTLDPAFFSSLFGLLYLGRALLSGVAFAVLLALALGAERRGVLRGLLCAALLVWLYLHYMQYLIVWSANLPREIDWYLARIADPWWATVWSLALLQGALPLALLFSPRSERPAVLGVLAGATLSLGLLEMLWWVLPAFPDQDLHWMGWLSLPAWLAYGALCALLWNPAALEHDHAEG